MSVVVITPPVQLVDLVTVKSHLRVEGSDEDALIGAYIAAASAAVDGPDGWLGRAVGAQVLELRQDQFCTPTRLPFGPVTSLTSVKYVDIDGGEQTLAGSVYTLAGDDLELAYHQYWPTIRGDTLGVRIRYAAGYATVPAPIVAAVLLMVGDLYANRETSIEAAASAVPMSTTVENLLSPYRAWR